ncbi:MAG: two-component system sensor histidine kinase NtrB, partial [Gemmataceae bacterium]
LSVQTKWFLNWQRDWSIRGHLSALLILVALGLLTMGPWFGTNPLRIGLLLIPLIAVLRSALYFRMAAMIDLFLFTVGLLYTYSHFDAGDSSNVKQLGLVLIVVMVSFVSLLVLAIAAIAQERDVVERNLRTREAEYRTMVEDNPAMICRFGPDGLLLYANLTYRRIFGDRVAHQPWQFLPMPDSVERETILRKLIPARVTDDADTLEMAIIVPSGDRRWFRWTTRAVDITSGQVSELHAIGLDVTEQHIAEQERAEFSSKVVQMQRLESVGLLAGGVAHEFNNLLTGILGNVELLQMDLPPGTHHGDSLEVIARNSARASQLTRQLSVYAGRGVALTGYLSLSELVEASKELIRVSLPRQVQIDYDLAAAMPLIAADEAEIRQLLVNLAVNAAEAMTESKAPIRIMTSVTTYDPALRATFAYDTNLLPGPHVRLSVQDEGHGIAEDSVSRVFEPFFTTKFVGRGLGLPAVLGIVRAHRGAIVLNSRVGKGTRVCVYFPLRNPELQSSINVSTGLSARWRFPGTPSNNANMVQPASGGSGTSKG